ncbi:hypothetical protein [Nocardia amamiensis]|uniref:hypothetical protein n=1 Tax=Nocardia amamiensis TaxID=404578 RepID=UPI00082FD884|nr:hypothetical protein [Nocardia amamiensis]
MRWVVLVGVAVVLSACSQSTTGNPQPVAGSEIGPSASLESELQARIDWVRQGSAIDLGQYHSASLDDGQATDLQSDIAFVSPTGKISCITGTALGMDGFDCIVELKQPAPAPGEEYGQWFGGYVTYSAQRLTVGQFRGDPGLFIHGQGLALPYDSTFTFGNYACRLATTGLTCVNPTSRSGVQLSDEGVVPLGCLREAHEAEREPAVGRAYRC